MKSLFSLSTGWTTQAIKKGKKTHCAWPVTAVGPNHKSSAPLMGRQKKKTPASFRYHSVPGAYMDVYSISKLWVMVHQFRPILKESYIRIFNFIRLLISFKSLIIPPPPEHKRFPNALSATDHVWSLTYVSPITLKFYSHIMIQFMSRNSQLNLTFPTIHLL